MSHREVLANERQVGLDVLDPLPGVPQESRGADSEDVVAGCVADLRHGMIGQKFLIALKGVNEERWALLYLDLDV